MSSTSTRPPIASEPGWRPTDPGEVPPPNRTPRAGDGSSTSEAAAVGETDSFRSPPAAVPRSAASERFRRRSGQVLALALMLSVAAHFLAFRLYRGFGIPELDAAGRSIASVELPPEIEIPPPPEAIPRPATPRVAEVEVSEDLTIAPTTFEANPVESLGPPPPTAAPDRSEQPRFIPYDTPPRLLNGAEIQRLLASEYPKMLKEAGIGGVVVVWLHVDFSGTVARTLVKESSGSPLLDAAAERVAARMRFRPARNRDKPTEVWVSQSIAFEVR